MATLTRENVVASRTNPLITSTIPQPFPVSAVEQERYLLERHLSLPTHAHDDISANEHANEVAAVVVSVNSEQASVVVEQESSVNPVESVQEIMPSIARVQSSCLMILNNLMLSSDPFESVVPNYTSSLQQDSSRSQSELYTLVSHLRQQTQGLGMTEVASSTDNSALVVELRRRVQILASYLTSLDVKLALALVSLLEHLDRWSTLRSTTSSSRVRSPSPSPFSRTEGYPDIFDTLKRSLSELQIERLSHVDSPQLRSGECSSHSVESAFLWSRIDAELESVLSICRERSETLRPGLPGLESQFPPEYDHEEESSYELPPRYDDPNPTIAAHGNLKGSKPQFFIQQDSRFMNSTSISNEKMRLDLEAISSAIDRLYLVAPQLHNQRVELKKSKLEEMEKARMSGQVTSPKGKQKQDDMKDLDEMVALIGRASSRKLVDQSVVLEGSLEARLEKARQRHIEKHQAFLVQLAKHSDAGRLHDQDAVLHPPKSKDPETLLSLPEFIREPIPTGVLRPTPQAIIGLPEFIKEPVPNNLTCPLLTPASVVAAKNSRGRSMSAPSLSWIFNPVAKPPSPFSLERRSSKKKRPGSSYGPISVPSAGLDLHYIAEHHENLQHVMVFFNVTGAVAGFNLEAEVTPGPVNKDCLIVTSGPRVTPPASLPASLLPGKKEVKVQSGHFELKLPTISLKPVEEPESLHTLLFDATTLNKCFPTSFICSSCSLPLVQLTRAIEYNDLPSEHWEELVDAWMCHSDQKLHEHVVKHASKGFWPTTGRALVGGSYIMFEKGIVTESNLCVADMNKLDEWQSVRCICGAIVGRSRKPPHASGEESLVYRLAKYAIRPVSSTAEPLRVPLSAFIIEDMQEYVHAHATYRFVLHDEEDDKPRILIWLFKPSIHIAYAMPTSYILPKSGCIHAAKVLFKLLGPSTDFDSIISRYPGFPQAEYLSYPLNVCHQLAALLKESNTAYPESMRIMTGLEVGFLQRAH